MSKPVGHDRLALIRIEGMHCHRCEAAIRKSLQTFKGVHEVEVDFPTGQASVLYDNDRVTAKQLMEAVNSAGYQATGLSQREADHPAGNL